MSLYSKVPGAGARIVSLMFAANFAPNFLGGGLMQGWLGTFWETMTHTAFFLVVAGICVGVTGAMIWSMEKPLGLILRNPMTEKRQGQNSNPPDQ